MGLKQIVKNMLGEERLSNYKGIACHNLYNVYFLVKGQSKISISSPLKKEYELTESGYHIFRGYYDIDYFDNSHERFLVHRLPIDAKTNRDTTCEIGYYNLSDNSFTKIADSTAWCWQQGSRLRWHPVEKDLVLFNDIDGSHYCTRIVDAREKKTVKTIERPLYDISSDFSWGISINFARLQRLRPGYGYNYFEDDSISESAPKNDGIFIVDLAMNSSRLIISLHDLAKMVDPNLEMTHYLNHISISPSGNRFMFFHIYVKKSVKGWNTVLYVCDKNGENLTPLESVDRVSHYCWVDNDHIMVTCHREDNSEYYCIYNVTSADKKMINIEGLTFDGHPSRITGGEWFVTDSYPREKSMQCVQFYRLRDVNTKVSVKVYHDYRLRGEKRCDLHPSVTNDGRYISIDTTYKKKKRSVIIFNCEEL